MPKTHFLAYSLFRDTGDRFNAFWPLEKVNYGGISVLGHFVHKKKFVNFGQAVVKNALGEKKFDKIFFFSFWFENFFFQCNRRRNCDLKPYFFFNFFSFSKHSEKTSLVMPVWVYNHGKKTEYMNGNWKKIGKILEFRLSLEAFQPPPFQKNNRVKAIDLRIKIKIILQKANPLWKTWDISIWETEPSKLIRTGVT